MIYTKRRQAESEDEKYITFNNTIKTSDINDINNINKKQQLFLDKAAEIAKYSTMQQKHGAVVVHKNKIIAYGFNYMTHYLNDNNSIHAEVAAISQVFKNKTILEDCDIYVVRIAPARYNNCLKLSKPCDKCTKFIKKYNIRCTYYSTNYEFDYLCSS
jgi:deoxycytidylate deaminase